MTKHAQKRGTSIPPDPFELVPEGDRTDDKLENDIRAWLAPRTLAEGQNGPAFIAWLKKVTDQNREILGQLFHRYGIPPCLILDALLLGKSHLLSREQLESGLWIKGLDRSITRTARILLPDTELAKIRRNKKLREEKAKILDNAAAVLDDYPIYLSAISDALVKNGEKPDEIAFDLPEYIRAIAADMRQQGRVENHRPKESAARMVLESLTDSFRLAVKRPLYEYAGLLTKACFPEEWNPAGDIREAAKKLVKSSRSSHNWTNLILKSKYFPE
jgi:hypothetical protein